MKNQIGLAGHERSDLLKSVATSPLDLLKVAVEAGLTFADCQDHFGVESSTNPFAKAAQAMYAEGSDDNIEIGERVVVSRCEYGAFVAARVFVWDWQAGLPEIVELIGGLVRHHYTKEGPGFAQSCPVLHDKVAMLEDLFTNHGDELESLSGKAPVSIPKARFVFGGLVEEGYTSDVIREVVGLGENSGFDPDHCEAIRNWLEHTGRVLDAQLRTVQVA
ncbi:hypothetical protein [Pseudomonas veronii]|uniref:hypothetical protein n=1 Tax=Pseudomonas veronii TaxID=76761 RepID=UPI0021C1FA41|nr:hypothetical protein [Pseudomonas veronii]MCT9827478.1 hypothetical protein [Pseudomonas veronii]